jgi:hypothetical protein
MGPQTPNVERTVVAPGPRTCWVRAWVKMVDAETPAPTDHAAHRFLTVTITLSVRADFRPGEGGDVKIQCAGRTETNARPLRSNGARWCSPRFESATRGMRLHRVELPGGAE